MKQLSDEVRIHISQIIAGVMIAEMLTVISYAIVMLVGAIYGK